MNKQYQNEGFQGHQLTYFFKRKADDEVFAVDTERQASHMFRRKDFNQKFEFLGKSDGSKFKEALKNNIRLTKKEAQMLMMPEDVLPDLPEAQQNIYWKAIEKIEGKNKIVQDAFEKEVESAKENPDKTQPRDFSKIDYN